MGKCTHGQVFAEDSLYSKGEKRGRDKFHSQPGLELQSFWRNMDKELEVLGTSLAWLLGNFQLVTFPVFSLLHNSYIDREP